MSEQETPFERIAKAEEIKKNAEKFALQFEGAMRLEMLTRLAEELAAKGAVDNVKFIKYILKAVEKDPDNLKIRLHNGILGVTKMDGTPTDTLIGEASIDYLANIVNDSAAWERIVGKREE